MIAQGMQHHDRVIAGFDDLVEIADRPCSYRPCQRPVLPQRIVIAHQVTAEQIIRREIAVTSDAHQWARETPGHVLDEPRLAAAGWPFEQHRNLVLMAMLEGAHVLTRAQIERLCVAYRRGRATIDTSMLERVTHRCCDFLQAIRATSNRRYAARIISRGETPSASGEGASCALSAPARQPHQEHGMS